MGPVVFMSMMRFESKHKSLKTLCKKGNNFKNITKTISTRNEAEFIYNGFTYKNEFKFGKNSRVHLTDFDHNDRIILAPIANQIETFSEIQWFKMNDITYRRGRALLIDNFIYSIERILDIDEKCYLLCHPFNLITFCSFTHSIIVEKCEGTNVKIIEFEKLTHKRSFEVKCVNSEYHVFAATLEISNVKNFQ